MSTKCRGLCLHRRSSKAIVAQAKGPPQAIWFRPNMRFLGVFGVLLVAGAGSHAFAGEIYYADTCVAQESGDLAGYVVILSRGEPLPSISMSWSEGALMLPVAAKITDYNQMLGSLEFSVHIEWGDFHFKGKIEPQRIEGTFRVPWTDTPEHVDLEIRSQKAAFEPDTECR